VAWIWEGFGSFCAVAEGGLGVLKIVQDLAFPVTQSHGRGRHGPGGMRDFNIVSQEALGMAPSTMANLPMLR
jgi:hypothetical protein